MTLRTILLDVLDQVWPPEPTYRIALRPDVPGQPVLDDIVVRDVEMFRMEQMGDWWWLCCYLTGTGEDHDRIAFHVLADGRCLVSEWPEGDVIYERGSVQQ